MARSRRKLDETPVPDRIVIPDLEGSIVVAVLHQADLTGFNLVIADAPLDLELLKMSARWVVATQEPPAGSTRFRGDTVVVTLRRDGGDGAGDREPRRPVPPRLAARPPMGDDRESALERALPPIRRTREELSQEATILRFGRSPGR